MSQIVNPSESGASVTPDAAPDRAATSWRIPAVDGFRALAMIMVIACHCWEFGHHPTLYIAPLGLRMEIFGFFKLGGYGVDLFMVLSGFCLFLPLCKSEQALARFHWKNFYKRRARRIIPPYYAGILFATLMPFALVLFYRIIHLKANWQPLPGSLYDYFAYAFFLQTLSTRSFGHINASLWSMGLEAQFYLMFPLVILGFRRLGLGFIALMIGISITYHLFMESYTVGMPPNTANLYFVFFLGRWVEFAAGMLAAWIVAHHRRQDMWRDAKWGTLGVLLSLAIYTFAASVDYPQYLGWSRLALLASAFALALVSVCVTRSPLGHLVSNPVMERLGFISYSVFLIHWPVVYYFGSLLERLHLHGNALFLALFPGGLLVTVALALVFFRLFEKPFLNPPSAARQEAAAAIA